MNTTVGAAPEAAKAVDPALAKIPPVEAVVEPVHTIVTNLEQNHIDQAIGASQTAMAAVETVLTVSTWALAIMGLVVALVAIVGFFEIRRASINKAGEIANTRFDNYMKGEDFKAFVQERIESAIAAQWEKEMMSSLVEDIDWDDELPPFPPGDEK